MSEVAAGATATVREVVAGWLQAVQDRDIEAVLDHFCLEGSWQNVPHPAAVGHDEIRAMLGPILQRSDRVVWDIVSAAYDSSRAWLERVDRFFIDGTEHAVQCNGVLEVDTERGVITELRDYVDLGEWRSRLAGVTLS